MKKIYEHPEIDIINFSEEPILTASIIVGGDYQPGEERVDGSDIFVWS